MRRTIIQIVNESAPGKPMCFSSEASWKEWIVSSHQSGSPVLRRNDVRRRRKTIVSGSVLYQVRPIEEIDYCADCSQEHRSRMSHQGRCMHNHSGGKMPQDTTTESFMRSEIERLNAELERERAESIAQQDGAFLYIAAIVNRFGGAVELTSENMRAAMSLQLSRADQADGGLWIKTTRKATPVKTRLE